MGDAIKLHALLGGTFEPIHYGHLQPAEALAAKVGLQKVTLMPNNVPPHRPQPEATPAQRVEMVRLAIAGNPLFELDMREMQRSTPSYTLETLEELRAERGPRQPLAFIIGQDSLLTIHKWHRWQELLSFCHLLVCQRPGYRSEMETPELQRWRDEHLTRDALLLQQTPAGKVFLAETPLVDISATEIRTRRHQDKSSSDLLPPAVSDYIDREGLYRNPLPRDMLRR
ncbi:nicotinate-nucleotide adenylyltransferase [Candidatus Erwinia dacicola]|uniref:Probable nicotinate-nucleotide adenylyltransferase n=1 Tax=Candidatus Erwinia dacicola TaxID=252393 RepID=A0A1E7Z458_9GAMM|nr:nicotinate-nucleotide adenylyltransferase [Candidatus Erwinia dacicola]NJC99297.1 nicotinate-nucleotide adenylyltransferase [Candidatus Erwinia dacicola]NJD85790.1 nicotinate-nucleotide adenylyltransferase [Candidatus Erwinia dacicola]OFC63552.1 nicotinic acid mononucleotide adenylyltransferase [Candidatus Erwinia dacicola]RAP71651.1 nicotinate (nicotinamide) nucleotide adenylyltransferase [Candidatus Erwinia dacicola]